VTKAQFSPRPDAGPDPQAALLEHREMWLPEQGGFVRCPVYDRDRLDCGNRLIGPTIVEQMDATTIILPGMTAIADPYLNLIVEVDA
jgi:N-methylhydantoinase A